MSSIEELKAENERLKAEVFRLRSLLEHHGINSERQENRRGLAAQRVALYRSFFRGREDVYAQRWFTKEGKKQYSPMVKREYRYAGKPAQEAAKKQGLVIYEPFDDAALVRHLKCDEGGRSHAYGLYLIVNDDECYVAAMDFDGANWQRDIRAMAETIEEHGFPFLIECSQSGKGAHLWFFFEGAIKAKRAREFCSTFITLTMERVPSLGMESYDRIFPSQDRVTTDGFGSLIALPLEGEARARGRTIFLDNELNVLDDPWHVLENLKKIDEQEIDSFLASIGSSFDVGQMGMNTSEHVLPLLQSTAVVGEVVPVGVVTLTLGAGITFPIAGLPSGLVNELKRIASFHNPEFYKAQRLRLSTWNKPRVISCAELEDGVLTLPRGCSEATLAAFKRGGIEVTIEDGRSSGDDADLSFDGMLRDEQAQVVKEMENHECGVLSAPTGFGKTVVAAALIASLKRSTLIIVHTRPLLLQWQERLKTFLGITPGLIGGGASAPSGIVDIAVINSLAQEQHHELLDRYGVVIVDECHHAAAVTYEQTLRLVRAKRVYGLTATPMRSDGHHDIIFMQCGPLIHRIDQKTWREQGNLVGRVSARFTTFRCDYQHLGIQEVYEKLSQDEERNSLIVADIEIYAKEGRSILVLSNRLEQLATLQAKLSKRGLESLVMSGSQSAKKKRQVQAYLDELQRTGKAALILSTGKYIGEGFDFPSLDTLVLAAPIAWKGSITQYVGRVSRLDDKKSDILVLDYVDFRIPVLTRMFAKRVSAFNKLGFTITQSGQKPDDDLLFTAQSYWPLLQRDLKDSLGPILFSVPYMSQGRVQALTLLLKELVSSKKVSFRVPVQTNIRLLTEIGVEVLPTDDDLVNCILIGERILWYGSINIFGAMDESDTLLRIEDPTYVAEVMRWLGKG